MISAFKTINPVRIPTILESQLETAGHRRRNDMGEGNVKNRRVEPVKINP
jgi:hypothetical protein